MPTWTCPNCGVAMTEQPRHPEGVPTGGQYAAMPRTEAEVSLRPLDGSFLYPPPMRNAEEIIDFWSRVEIPDVVLARTQAVYQRNRQMLVDGWAELSWNSYPVIEWEASNPPPETDDPGEIADWEGRQQAARVEYEQALQERLDQLPAEIDRAEVRSIFRATAMFHTVAEARLDDGERVRVCRHLVDTPDGPRTVGDLATETGLIGISSRIVSPENYDADGDGIIDATTVSASDWDRMRSMVDASVDGRISETEEKTGNALAQIQNDNVDNTHAIINAGDPEYGKKRRFGRG